MIIKLKDNEFEYKGINRTRISARGFILNDKNEVLLNLIRREDSLDEYPYFESPGGGKKENEDLIDCLRREIKEETGYIIKDIRYLGEVRDYYNVLYMKNISHYYYARIESHSISSKDEYEKNVIISNDFYDIESAINNLKSAKGKIGRLVSRRESIMLEELKNLLEGGKLWN